MRIFWTIIALLVLATAGLVIARRIDTKPAATTTPQPVAPAPVQPTRAAPPPETPRQPDPATTPVQAPAPVTQPPVTPPPVTAPPAPPVTPVTPAPEVAPTPAAGPAADPEPEPAPAAAAQPEAKPETTAAAEEPDKEPTPAETAAAPKPAENDAATANSTPPATVTTPGATKPNRFAPSAEDLAAAESAKGPPSMVKQPDGTTLVADRFVIKGEGTKESPYEVTWEQLMSAQETYKPRLGLKIIPGWLDLIHDKWVKISGYVAFPVMAQGPDEMLMMLNQWDGCCIGVPPTPYDAIEVKLDKPAEGETRLLIMGSVTGKLKVDPYLVKDWLVSLYIMDEATVSKQSGAPMRESEVVQEHLAP